MAIRLAEAFGGSSEVWVGLQLDFDRAKAMTKADQGKVRPFGVPEQGD
jgi:plasmid maintenance system antidote protein VapI